MKNLLILLLLFLTVGSLPGETTASEQRVAEAWAAWEQNDQQAVDSLFQTAIAEDENNLRAYIGLALLYQLQNKHDAAWDTYRQIFTRTDNFHPYLYAASSTEMMQVKRFEHDGSVMNVWQQMLTNPNSDGLLKAMAHEYLGDYYEKQGDLPASREQYAQLDAITDWMMIGPFDNTSASGFANVFPPEQAYEPGATYEGKNRIPAGWFAASAVRPDRWIDFRRYFAFENAVYYGNTFIFSPRQQSVYLRIGTSGSLKAFVNDDLVISYFDENNNDLDTYTAEVVLQKGWNRLLIKCGFSEINQCNFMVRITDAQGAPVTGIRRSTERQSYKKRPGTTARMIPNFAEAYFREQISAYPDRLENYLLLAYSYLRNDKAIEGELVLKEAIERSPNCALLHLSILEAFQRGEKFDEVATTMERLYQLDPRIPDVLAYRFERYLENDQPDRAETILRTLESLIPESEALFQHKIAFYSNKRQIEKIIETSGLAYERYPQNFQLAQLEASIAEQTTRTYDRSIEIFRNYLAHLYDLNGLSALANSYLKASDIAGWELTYGKIFQLDPSAVGFYYQMANTFVSLQQYERAAQTLQKAIDICPNSANYWSKLGEIHRSSNQLPQAIAAYRQALRYNPADYDAREILRELEGKPSIFSNFDEISIDAVIAAAPDAEAYAEDDAVILLDNLQRVVYREGTSQTAEEMLIRVFNSRGIDQFKEYWISHNGHTENLNVEKAVVIKEDGAEIKADVSRNHVVFKSLEEGDFIYMKWRIKNFYSGKLSHHFWDQFHFNSYTPIKDIRYSLLVPADLSFQYHLQNSDVKPLRRRMDDGELYQWRMSDVPAIEFEYGMPILEDVGMMLHISSIDDWAYMVDWYRDLAASKTRASFEVRDQVKRLFADRPQASDEEKISTIYNFITENIRYSSVSFRQSGLIPQKARDVLVNRIGDCKDVSTLCIAMLREAGIDAHYVLVNTKNEGKNAGVLPSIAFNHCITGVETDGGIRYLDLTAENYAYGSLPELDVGGFSLLIKPGIKEPFYMNPQQFSARNILRSMEVQVHADNGVTVEKKTTRTGSMAAYLRNSYQDDSQAERVKSLTETLAQDFPDVKVHRFDFANIEETNAPLYYEYVYEVPEYLSEVGDYKFLRLPWADALESNRALSYEQRQHPYQFWPEADTVRESLHIQLPPGVAPLEVGKDVYLSCPIADYTLTFTISEGVISGMRQIVYKQSIVYPETYREFRKFYNQVVKEDQRQILLRSIQQQE